MLKSDKILTNATGVDLFPDMKTAFFEDIATLLSIDVKRVGWVMIPPKNPVCYSDATYRLRIDYITIADFNMQQMVGCCGICVSSHAYVAKEFRNKGLGTYLNKLRIDVARHNGFGVLICTYRKDNITQKNILMRNGWKNIFEFINPRTKNKVYISIINL